MLEMKKMAKDLMIESSSAEFLIFERQKMPTRAKQIASKFESDDQMQNRTIKQIIERAKNKNPKIS